jgi:hypothetical protein
VLSPPPPQAVGIAEVSLPAAKTMDEFVSGIKPGKPERKAGRYETTPDPIS